MSSIDHTISGVKGQEKIRDSRRKCFPFSAARRPPIPDFRPAKKTGECNAINLL